MVKLSVTEAWIAILSVFLILAPVLTQTDNLKCETENIHKAPIRIVDDQSSHSNPSHGRLEVCLDDRWGTVCNSHNPGTSNFTKSDTQVACYQMGFAGSSDKNFASSCKERVTCAGIEESIWMTDVNCTGKEQYLTSCHFNDPKESNWYCSHSDDVMISCSDNLQVALWQDTVIDFTGQLHYFDISQNDFEVVCVENTSDSNGATIGQVACKQLGLGSFKSAEPNTPKATTAINTDIVCNGSEDKLYECPKSYWNISAECSGRALFISCHGSAPRNVFIDPHSVGSSTATLTWDMSDQLQYYPVITSYNIMYQSAGTAEEIFTFTAPSTDVSPKAKVTDLDPLTEYTFRVAAVFGRTVGPYSDPVRATTEADQWIGIVAFLSLLSIALGISTIILCCCTFGWNGFCIYEKNNGLIKIFNKTYAIKCCLKRKDASRCCNRRKDGSALIDGQNCTYGSVQNEDN